MWCLGSFGFEKSWDLDISGIMGQRRNCKAGVFKVNSGSVSSTRAARARDVQGLLGFV